MTAFLLALVVLGTVFGDLLKAHAMRSRGALDSMRGPALLVFVGAAARNPWFHASVGAYAVSFFGFMALLSVEDVSFAVPATAAGYALETLLAAWVLREHVSSRRWVGAALVIAGVCLIV